MTGTENYRITSLRHHFPRLILRLLQIVQTRRRPNHGMDHDLLHLPLQAHIHEPEALEPEAAEQRQPAPAREQGDDGVVRLGLVHATARQQRAGALPPVLRVRGQHEQVHLLAAEAREVPLVEQRLREREEVDVLLVRVAAGDAAVARLLGPGFASVIMEGGRGISATYGFVAGGTPRACAG